MHRFYMESKPPRESPFRLPEPEAHHAIKVLRIQPGEKVTLLNGAGSEYLCQVQETGRRQVLLNLLEEKIHPPAPYRMMLLQAVPKGKTMDLIVQKATELGVARLVPLLTERTVPQITPGEAPAKVEKWRATAIEALKQCGSPWLPQIEFPLSPESVKTPSAELELIAALSPAARHPRAWLEQFRISHGRRPSSVAVWVGPEGDFTPEELKVLFSAGVHPITLGPWVLRSETAAIYSLSILSYELSSPGGIG